MGKRHVPKPGHTGAAAGTSLCLRFCHWRTGDHDLIRRQATAAINGTAEDRKHWCSKCLATLRG